MVSGPITSWQIDGEKVEAVTDFLFLGSKITVDGDCSHEIKRCLLVGRKAMTNPDSILNSKDITLQTKVHIIKAMAFPVVMYKCESWTIKKAKCRRIDAFKLWCWRRLLTSPLDSKVIKPVNPKGNQPWIFTGRTHAEAPILWATWCEEQLIGRKAMTNPDSILKSRRITLLTAAHIVKAMVFPVIMYELDVRVGHLYMTTWKNCSFD